MAFSIRNPQAARRAADDRLIRDDWRKLPGGIAFGILCAVPFWAAAALLAWLCR